MAHETERRLGIGQLDGGAALLLGELVTHGAVVGDRRVHRGHPLGQVVVADRAVDAVEVG